MPSFNVPERAKIAALAVAGLVVVVLWGYLLTATPKSKPFTPPPGVAAAGVTSANAAPATPTRVTVIGGAFTAPTSFGGRGAMGWPQLVAARYGWQVDVQSDDGAGYLTAGSGGKTLPQLVDAAVATKPDVVLVAGGRADVGQDSPDAIASAAGQMLQSLRRQLPNARLVVLGPVATDAQAPAGATGVRDSLRFATAAVPNTTFVDPLDENWFADAPAGAIAADGQHPTDVGHKLIADKLEADLVKLGIARG